MLKIFPIFLLAALCSGSWITFDYRQGRIPSYIFPYYLNSGDQLKVHLSWPGNEDLDIYLYQSGVDLLSNSSWLDRQYSSNINPQILEHTISTTGNYIIRLDLFSSVPTGYYCTISVNGNIMETDSNTLIKKDAGITTIQVNLAGSCTLRVTYTGPSGMTYYFYAPGADVLDPANAFFTSTGVDSFQMNPNQSGNWYFVIKHGITSTTTYQNFTLLLETDSNSPCSGYCDNKLYTTSIVPGSENQCNCESKFNWDNSTKQCKIDCNLVQNALFTPISNIACDCQGGYGWNNVTVACESLCFQNQTWNSSTSSCWLKCWEINNTAGNVNETVCQCVWGYEWANLTDSCQSLCTSNQTWNSTSSSCWLNCNLINNTVGSNDETSCQCQGGYEWANLTDSCQSLCTSNQTWNSTTSSCWLNCNSINNTLGNNDETSCLCQGGYEWANLTDSCQSLCTSNQTWNSSSSSCWLKCNLINNTVGSNDETSCQCQGGYEWATLTGECSSLCTSNQTWNSSSSSCWLKCNLINNTVGNNNQTNCLCQGGYEWSTVSSTCEWTCTPDQIWNATNTSCWRDCSIYNNSVGNVDSNTCLCQSDEGYQWNSSELSCNFICNDDQIWNVSALQCWLNCSLFQNGLQNIDNETCNCDDPQEWDPSTKECNLLLSANLCILKAENWDVSKSKCVTNCSNVKGAVKQVDDETCQCQQKLFWMKNDKSCSGEDWVLLWISLTLLSLCLCHAFYYFLWKKRKNEKEDETIKNESQRFMKDEQKQKNTITITEQHIIE